MSKESSKEMASLASKIIRITDAEANSMPFFDLLRDAQSLAGSVLAQREKDPNDIADTNATFDGLLIATTLANLIREEGGGRSNITISPKDIAEMLELYDFEDNRDGLLRTIKLKPMPGTGQRLRVMQQDEDTSNARPQAEPKPERPVWAIRYFNTSGDVNLAKMLDRSDAQRHLADYVFLGVVPPTIENRMCMHPTCPSEKCTEVTS